MQLVHVRGWRVLHLPHIDGDGVCHRLCLGHTWIGDYCSRDLQEQLTARGLLAEDFTPAESDCCVVVDPSTQITCLRPAEPVDGQAHLPLCARCRRTLATMRGFPRLHDTPTPAAAIPSLSAPWFAPSGEDRRELSHHIRHPVAKILGWAEILHDDDTVDPVHARQLEVIYRCAKDLQRLLDRATSPL